MPAGLRRYYGKGHLHFITFSCYRRLPLLKSARPRDSFVSELAKLRDQLGFRLVGYRKEPRLKTKPGAPTSSLNVFSQVLSQ